MKRLTVLLVALAAACSQKSNFDAPVAQKKALAFPVEVAPVELRKVEYQLGAVGSVEAFETLQITARVPGAVDAARFTEGQTVKAGDVLVEIDARRYALAVKAAQASIAKAKAAYDDTEAGMKRREAAQAKAPGLLPAEELETFRNRFATASADLAAAQVALERAQVDLRDAYVRAPAAGVIQTRAVQTGQYVQVGTPLATMVRKDPLLVRFKVPEDDAKSLTVGQNLQFVLRGERTPMSARITFVADSADPTSRMVAVTGEVAKEDVLRARPGAFAEINIPVGATKEAPVIPQSAVRPSERGFLAYVIEGDTAHERVLTLGMRTADGLIEVRDGLQAGAQVVVRGAEALKEGAKVTVTPWPTNQAEPGAAGTGGMP
ncbi:MAG: efflux RND transporter periplasmic adaptor subunit [Myxococcaceae bacterium]|nr:efflux RND transporter periplasmic adaptor subunit [Myxococcaceae bacterium]